jgi:hypothetical protein
MTSIDYLLDDIAKDLILEIEISEIGCRPKTIGVDNNQQIYSKSNTIEKNYGLPTGPEVPDPELFSRSSSISSSISKLSVPRPVTYVGQSQP